MLSFSLAFSLFTTAFLAATILPVASEGALAAALALSEESWALLIGAASLGNVLGSIVNWWLGRLGANPDYVGRMKVKPETLARAQGWYRKWGRASLLLSWAPIFGDLLTGAAGAMREPLHIFIPLVAIAKTGRYIVVAAAVSGLV